VLLFNLYTIYQQVLIKRLRAQLASQIEMMAGLRLRANEYHKLAMVDPLTGLYNRRFFEDQCDKELNRALRYNQHLAIVIMDLHRFKAVNDRHGHPRGDALLRMAAATLRKSLRTSDYAFRIGGDEFALLLVQADAEQALTLARRVRTNFAAAAAPMGMAISTGIDYGVAFYPKDGEQKEVLIRVADERLYEMKRSQRDANHRAEAALQPPAGRVPTEPPAAPPVQISEAGYSGSERRKWERVSLVGTRAHAKFNGESETTARVLDLGYGGVAIEMVAPEPLGANFHAVLHVPILPPVRVSLRKLYELPCANGLFRIGCAFVT
jgi:diguanylate cyclase (GGDEF)-like protein